MRVHLTATDKVNHLTNHPRPLQTDRHELVSDQRWLKELFEEFLANELNEKGLNYATSHYLNGSETDPVRRLMKEAVLQHSFKDGEKNFLGNFYPDRFKRSTVLEGADEEFVPDEKRVLNQKAKERVAKRRQIQAKLDAEEREELRRQLFNMYFKMKEIVQNLNDSNPEDPSLFSEEKKLAIVDGLRKHLLPKAQRKGGPKDEPINSLQKCQAVRDYLMVRSDELKEEIYEDVFFEENLNKNQNDKIMAQLGERLEPKNYEKFKSIGGNKAKEFMRLLITRQLMMKEERDRVILKRLQAKKLEENEEEELRRILNNYQKKEDKSKKKVSVVPKLVEKPHSKADSSAVYSRAGDSALDQISLLGALGGPVPTSKRSFTAASSRTNLDLGKPNNLPKKRVETLVRFDVPGADKKQDEPSSTVVRIKEEPTVFAIPTKEEERSTGTRGVGGGGRFKKKEFVDLRNDVVRAHEGSLKTALAIQALTGTSVLPPREAVAL